MKTIAIVDPASYALTYDYQYIKTLAKKYKIDFYCSSTKFNHEYINKISNLENVCLLEYNISNGNKIIGLKNLFIMYVKILSSYKKYSSINFQWSIFPLIEIPFFCIIKNKLLFTFHNSVPHKTEKKTVWFNKIISRISKKNIFVSTYTKNIFEKNYGFYNNKNHILNHGVMPLTDSTSQFENKPIEPFMPQSVTLVFWGNIKEYKGVDMLLSLAPSLHLNNIKLNVYGKYDDDLIYIHNKLNELNHSSVNDYLPLDYIERILIDKDTLMVLPYKRGSQSGVMFNCLALGTPFISSNVGESAKFLADNDLTEMVFVYGDNESLLKSVNFFIANKTVVIEKFDKLKRRYSWEYDDSIIEEIFE
ncbi:glycosyltransferase [Providencia huaxiensis]|uniref:glycosyltransferase n=1 Tax=Providencia huaxiensis TaxID=2027290 RepID=UPI0024AB9FD4|nr:glycosyltransferase family 4 protein [Providencia rettgeri]ELR5155983.1 glycosyltransferase family 4 protein [Providencia rettgeri]HEC8343279.1 glycosyltransferase family 4 protein [Providencia rettgeri]